VILSFIYRAREKVMKSDRERSLFLTSVTGILAKILTASLSFFSIRMILMYLGVEKYGLWATLSSFVALMGFMDFGFGNQLMNNVAKAQGANGENFAEIRKQISIACVSLALIVLAFLSTFCISFYFVRWEKLFATPEHLAPDLYSTLTVIGLCFGITLLVNLISLIQRGLQKGYYANLWELGRSISSFLFLIFVIKADLGMKWVSIAIFAFPLFFAVLNWIWFFTKNPQYFPKTWKVKFRDAIGFFKQGSLFFYLQVAAILAYQTDSLILAHYTNYESVTEYTVGMKLFAIPALLTDTYMASLWPAYAHAYGRRDFTWIKNTFKKSILISALFLLLSAVAFIFLAPYVVDIWLGGEVKISRLLLIVLGCWLFLNAFNGNISCLLNALNIARPQAIIVAVVLTLNIVLSIWLVNVIGVPGVLLGTVIALAIGGLIPYYFLVRKIFNSFQNRLE